MTEKELHLALCTRMNDAVETARQAAAVRSFLEQELLDLSSSHQEIARLIKLLVAISLDIIELVNELNGLPTDDGELPARARQLIADLKIEVDSCKTMLDSSPDIFMDPV